MAQKAEVPKKYDGMLIHRLKVSGFLSFGPEGVDLPMERLNVLIGPNGSGKSNFLEIVALLRTAPGDISDAIARFGGVREWLWKGPESPNRIALEAELEFVPHGGLRHALVFADRNGRVEIVDERIQPLRALPEDPARLSFFRPPRNGVVQAELGVSETRSDLPESRRTEGSSSTRAAPDTRVIGRQRGDSVQFAGDFNPDQSLLALVAIPDYPGLWHLKEQYSRIRLYRNWSFGPSADLRNNRSAHDRAEFLEDGGGNLALVLSHFKGESKRGLVRALRKLFDGIVDISCPVSGGTVALFLEETGNRSIPASRLSDGTLRYLCLLAILLHPEPPPLVVIEEPELGLHPDLLPTIADLLLAASERTQLVVTTHSDVLVDALTERPECIVVCEKHDGQTEMRRLGKDDIGKWLADYRLGDLWTSGELGGNRW